MLKLTVLGNPDQYLKPLAGGSGYLLEAGDARILLDCGHGVAAALAEAEVDPGTIDAVVLSHFHYDHVLDLLPVSAALRKGTPLFVPAGTRGNLAAIARAYAFDGSFDPPGPLVEARAGEAHAVKRARLDFLPTVHSATSVATRARAGGRTLVYASDTASSPALAEFAAKADILLAHTLLPTVEAGSEHARVHMTAEAAGALAREAGAKNLLLSHRYWESSAEAMRAAAALPFPDVKLAERRVAYEVR